MAQDSLRTSNIAYSEYSRSSIHTICKAEVVVESHRNIHTILLRYFRWFWVRFVDIAYNFTCTISVCACVYAT